MIVAVTSWECFQRKTVGVAPGEVLWLAWSQSFLVN